MIALVGILTILAGILPLLNGLNLFPANFTSGPIYSGIIIVIGLIGLVYAFMSPMLMGAQKFMPIMFGLLIILGGILPFIKSIISLPIPTDGVVYALIIIVIGVSAMIYGFKTF